MMSLKGRRLSSRTKVVSEKFGSREGPPPLGVQESTGQGTRGKSSTGGGRGSLGSGGEKPKVTDY